MLVASLFGFQVVNTINITKNNNKKIHKHSFDYICISPVVLTMNSRIDIQVDGFQLEPERNVPDEGNITEYSRDEHEEIQLSTTESMKMPASEWCHCGGCNTMPTERECLCCSGGYSKNTFDW